MSARAVPEWKRRYDENKAAGLCVRCGRPALLSKRGRRLVRCGNCLTYAAAWQDNKRSLNNVKGMCSECGRRPFVKPYRECNPCRQAKLQRTVEWREAQAAA